MRILRNFYKLENLKNFSFPDWTDRAGVKIIKLFFFVNDEVAR
jgi:hypothetical protein